MDGLGSFHGGEWLHYCYVGIMSFYEKKKRVATHESVVVTHTHTHTPRTLSLRQRKPSVQKLYLISVTKPTIKAYEQGLRQILQSNCLFC